MEKISRDKDDDKILKCGIESKADFIITGDKDLLVLKEYKNIRIINPREYLEIVYERLKRRLTNGNCTENVNAITPYEHTPLSIR